jgi:predicted nucleic acid-binding protein
MKIFLDTSSLFKLYHIEDGTEQLIELFKNNSIEIVYLAEITKIEFDSVVWKKFRKNELDETTVQKIIKNFEKDSKRFFFIRDNTGLKKSAKGLISKYGKEGLRTLDSIQLSSAISVRESAQLFITSDRLLQKLLELENLKTIQ